MAICQELLGFLQLDKQSLGWEVEEEDKKAKI